MEGDVWAGGGVHCDGFEAFLDGARCFVGRELHLDENPPAVARRGPEESVRRWVWRNVAAKHVPLAVDRIGNGPSMRPVWKLHKSRQQCSEWNGHHRAALGSVLANRQRTQERCHTAGVDTEHNRCLFCMVDDPETAAVVSLGHRCWHCQRTEPLCMRALEVMRTRVDAAVGIAGGDFALDRGLLQAIDERAPKPSKEALFHWVLEPPGGIVSGTAHIDGSQLDGPSALLRRFGQSFVAVDDDGEVTTAANGVPPDLVDTIGGAEAWAVHEITMRARSGTGFRVDCKPCVDMVASWAKVATSGKRMLARAYKMLFGAMDAAAEMVVWMPAHTTEDDVGRKLPSNGA